MLESLKKTDTDLFLYLNGKHSPFWDEVMKVITYRFTWIPLYVLIAVFLVWRFKKEGIYLLFFLVALIAVSDQISSSVFKPYFERPRPCHDPLLEGLVRVVDGCGGSFGFISSHASNTFALTTFLILLLYRSSRWILLFIPWAVTVSYSRIYLGVHYPGDILVGALLGIVLGIVFFMLCKKLFLHRSMPAKSEL